MNLRVRPRVKNENEVGLKAPQSEISERKVVSVQSLSSSWWEISYSKQQQEEA